MKQTVSMNHPVQYYYYENYKKCAWKWLGRAMPGIEGCALDGAIVTVLVAGGRWVLCL